MNYLVRFHRGLGPRPDQLVDLSGMNRAYLQAVCRRLGVTGYSRMTRQDLKDAIIGHATIQGSVWVVKMP